MHYNIKIEGEALNEYALDDFIDAVASELSGLIPGKSERTVQLPKSVGSITFVIDVTEDDEIAAEVKHQEAEDRAMGN